MKKLLVVMLSLCMMIGLTACGGDTGGGSSNDVQTELITTDEFIESLKNGLEARWEASESQRAEEYTTSESAYIAYYASLDDAELNNIGNYRDCDFQDESVGKLAKEYIETLEAQKEELNDFPYKMYTVGYNYHFVYNNHRANILSAFNNISEITFYSDDKNEAFQSECVVYPNVDDEPLENVISVLNTDAYYKSYGDGVVGDVYDVYATIKNNTNFNLDYIYLDVTPYDEDGVALDPQSILYENIEPYESVKSSTPFFRDDIKRDRIKFFEIDFLTINGKDGTVYYESLEEVTRFDYEEIIK